MATVYGNQISFDSGKGWWRTKVDYSGSSATVTLEVKSGYTVFVKITGKINGVAESKLSYNSNATSTHKYPTTFSISETASNTIALTCTGGGWGQNGTSTATIPQQKGSFNLNILNPDGSEPYSTGEAGSVERSINGGTYERKYNEDASSYAIGTTFNYRNFTPGTGRKLSSVSGLSPNNTTGPWSATMGTGGLVVEFKTAWQTYNIAYSANGGTGAPGAQTKTYGTDLTLSSTKPTRDNSTATGYTVTFNGNGGTPSKTSQAATNTLSYTFNNWKATNGTTYAPGAAYTANEGTTLTAQWNTTTTKGSITMATASKSNGTSTCQVNFNSHGGTNPATVSTTATITYTLNGWYTAASGGSKVANGGATYTPSANTEVFAQWKSTTGTYGAVTLPGVIKPDTYEYRTVSINTNGGSSTITSVKSTKTTEYSCNGWYTAETGGTKVGSVGGTYTPTATTTLHAQYSTNTSDYSSLTLPTAEQCTKEGFILKGYSTELNGEVIYKPGQTLTPTQDLTIYAVWESGQAKLRFKQNGEWIQGKLYVKKNGHWYEAKTIYQKTNGHWYQGSNN